MNTLLVVLLLSASAVSVPTGCLQPFVFSGRGVATLASNNQINSFGAQEIYVDANAKQVRVDLFPFTSFTPIGTVYQDFVQDVSYFYNRIENVCFKIANGILPNLTILLEANFIQTYSVGSQSVNSFGLLQGDILNLIDVTDSNCYPVYTAQINVSNPASVYPIVSYQWSNIVPFVPPYTFDLPALCNGARVARLEELPTQDVHIFGRSFNMF